MRAGANNAIRELGGLFGVGVLALEEFQNAWHELFAVLEDGAVSGVLVARGNRRRESVLSNQHRLLGEDTRRRAVR